MYETDWKMLPTPTTTTSSTTTTTTTTRVAYIMCFLMFSKSLDYPGLWLCVKRIHGQQFVKETAFYREQLLFQLFTIFAFLASKSPNCN